MGKSTRSVNQIKKDTLCTALIVISLDICQTGISFHHALTTVRSICLEIIQTWSIFLYAHPQVVYYNCVNFHLYLFTHLGGVAPTRYMDRQTLQTG